MWPGGFLGNARPSGITLKQPLQFFYGRVFRVRTGARRGLGVFRVDSPCHLLSFSRLISHSTPLAGGLAGWLTGWLAAFLKNKGASPQTEKRARASREAQVIFLWGGVRR